MKKLSEISPRTRKRLVALVAAFFASLACGTTYVYSTYSTQLADRIGLTATQSSLLGIAGQTGLSLFGPLTGLVIDRYPPYFPIFVGAIFIFGGFHTMYNSYVTANSNFTLLVLAYGLAGLGNTFVFNTSVRTSAINWPKARGTATSVPMSAFGLSALFFSSVAGLIFPGDTEGFLQLLSLLTSGLAFVSLPFIRVHRKRKQHLSDIVDRDEYTQIHDDDNTTVVRFSSTNQLQIEDEDDEFDDGYVDDSILENSEDGDLAQEANKKNDDLTTPSTSLLSDGRLSSSSNRAVRSSTPPVGTSGASTVINSPTAGPTDSTDDDTTNDVTANTAHNKHPHQNVGYKLLFRRDFWEYFLLLGFVSGVGQMYIYSCGYCIRALVHYSNPEFSPAKVQSLQALQVALISSMNFFGRITSGSLSDWLVHKLNVQRLWILVVSLTIGLFGHILAIYIYNPIHMWIVSISIGLSYGLVFGVYPSIVSESFGLKHFSQNWGYVASSPVFSAYFLNLMFGKIYDSNSFPRTGGPNGELANICLKGPGCYSLAFTVTSFVSVFGILLALFMIHSRKGSRPHEYHEEEHLF